ncbi:MAG: PorV/PorQ family protein [Elusimicrobia bacterium]|nr:PorV/PorQ family protein [Elusimicrobiota bacterium]
MRRQTILPALALAVALTPIVGVRAADFTKDSIGTTGGDFLLMDLGARGIAMGGAYSAVTNDAYSLYWNPAGLTRVPRFSANFTYGKYFEDINYQSGAVAKRINDTGVFGAGFRYRDVGLVDNTDLSGNKLGEFRPRDYVAEIGWGQSVFDLSDSEVDVTMGGTVRWLHSDYLLQADGYGGDLGIQSRFYTGPYTYDVSLVAQNMGIGQNFDRKRDTMPFRMRLGGAMWLTRNLLLSLEGIMPINNVAHGALGVEYTVEAGRGIKLAMRAGFNSLTLESLNVESGASAGLGLSAANFSFDYSFSPMGLLGDQVHRFTISYNLPAKASRRYRER